PRRARLSDHPVRERLQDRPHVRAGHRRGRHGHRLHGLYSVARRPRRSVAATRAIEGGLEVGHRLLAFTFVSALIVTACGGGGGGGGAPASPSASAAAKAVCDAKKITIAVPVTPPNVVHLTPYVADSFGYFKDENLTVELVRFDGGVGSLRASASGAIDLAGTSTEPVVDAIANGADVKIIYTYAPHVHV